MAKVTKSRFVGVRLTDALYKKLASEARRRGLAVSKVIREILTSN